ncbi:MAG TPA: cytochrome c oxidase subunit II [Candidatus Acidoferrales bacterium]|nr:cytochrome c oxidase subunit II [Candidatus Acidoferrales bacterium]
MTARVRAQRGVCRNTGHHDPATTWRACGGAAPAAMFAVALTVLVGASVYFFVWGKWNPPAAITPVGNEIDAQYRLTLIVTGAVFILAQLGLAFAILRYRDRGKVAHYSHGNSKLEFVWTFSTAVVFLGLGLLGYKAWGTRRLTPAAPNAVRIEVTTAQFVYYFRYPGPDGKFGSTSPKLIDPATGNPLGIVPGDPAGRDDIVVPTLTVPVNREIELLIRSQDVIHSVFVRELRLQQDSVPGMTVPLHFTPNRTGRYDIVCTQLCGLGHHRMHSYLNVVSRSEYEKFLTQQERLLQQTSSQ